MKFSGCADPMTGVTEDSARLYFPIPTLGTTASVEKPTTAYEARTAYQYIVGDAETGVITERSIRDLHKREREYVAAAQMVLGVTPNGVVGPVTIRALWRLRSLPDDAVWPSL